MVAATKPGQIGVPTPEDAVQGVRHRLRLRPPTLGQRESPIASAAETILPQEILSRGTPPIDASGGFIEFVARVAALMLFGVSATLWLERSLIGDKVVAWFAFWATIALALICLRRLLVFFRNSRT